MALVELTQLTASGPQTGSAVDGNGATVDYTISGAGGSYTAGWGDIDTSNIHLGDSASGPETMVIDFMSGGSPYSVTGMVFRLNATNDTETMDFTINGVDVDLNTLIANGDVTMIEDNGNTDIDANGDLIGETTTYSLSDAFIFNIPVQNMEIAQTGFGNGSLVEIFIDDSVVSTPPCFTTGMMIRTDAGYSAIEDLEIGDQIWTLDHGFQTLRFVSRRNVPAMGKMTPVLFKKGSIGNTADIVVSQKHRFHVGSLPQDLQKQFRPNEDTLLQAISFCNGTSVRLYPEIKTVEYFHLMFDNHELIDCFGTISESWQPTRNALKLNPDQADELLSIFPEIGSRKASDPGAMARYEVRVKRARPQNHA
ncbi:MAG: Hint domain-containing protein [Planktomarina sp.]